MALFLHVMIDRTCRVRVVTEGRIAVALAWPSTSCVIKAKGGRYYGKQISRQDVVMVVSMDPGANFLGSVLEIITNSNSQLC